MELGFSEVFTSYEMELETHVHVQIEKQNRVLWTKNCMLSLGLTSYEMEPGFYDLFTSYEMELETHVHEQIENQLGFHELEIACYH